jgi:pyruvate/2-oxoglutarate/acetoin dehydrogenase E1 component
MERILSYPEAIREALDQEMARDASVFVLGMGVDDPKRILGTTSGLLEKYGPGRLLDTPLAEDGMTGVAIGAALAGLRPVHVHIRMDFLLLAMNQLVNMAAKMSYMYAGAFSVPLVIRATIGKSWGQGAQHSQSLYPLFMNIPGIKVVAPATPYDAKGCLSAAIRDDNPVLFVEHRLLYYQKGPVPEEPYAIPFGRSRVLTRGADVTLVGISQMAIECLRAGSYLSQAGISAEVITPLSLSPLDIGPIRASVEKTGRLVVVDNAWMPCGAGAEIIARLVEGGGAAGVKMERMGFAFVPCPTSPPLEQEFYPNARTIAARACRLVDPARELGASLRPPAVEEIEFKGPF